MNARIIATCQNSHIHFIVFNHTTLFIAFPPTFWRLIVTGIICPSVLFELSVRVIHNNMIRTKSTLLSVPKQQSHLLLHF